MSVDGSSVPPPFLRINVAPASAAERPLLEGLFQFYVYDFAEFATPELTAFEFDEAGRIGGLSPYEYVLEQRRPVAFADPGRRAHGGLCAREHAVALRRADRPEHGRVFRRATISPARHSRRGGSLDLRDASRTVGGCRSSAEFSGKIVLAESYRPCTERSRNPSGGTETTNAGGVRSGASVPMPTKKAEQPLPAVRLGLKNLYLKLLTYCIAPKAAWRRSSWACMPGTIEGSLP